MQSLRFAIVTGKGGVGKTTVTAALARAAVLAGKRVLAVEIAKPGRLASVLGERGLTAEPRAVSAGLCAVTLDEERCLEEFIAELIPLRLLSRRLLGSPTFRVLSAAIPGITEIAMLSRLVSWLDEEDRFQQPRYDLVILDAPASGHTVPLLATPRTIGSIAVLGPLAESVRRIARWLTDPERTSVLVVALPEDWAVAEAIELRSSLCEVTGVALGPPIVNAVFPRRFSPREAALLFQAKEAASVDEELLTAGLYFVRRRAAAREQLRILRAATGTKPIETPFIFTPRMQLADLDPMAAALTSLLGA